MILVVAEEEFLILSWTGAGTMGVFINLNGDPVRGTLQWPSHPLSICASCPSTSFAAERAAGLEYPYVTALLPDQTIQVHHVGSQEIAQVVPAPPLPSPNETSLKALLGVDRSALAMSSSGFLVPSRGQSDKLRLKKVNLLSRNAKPGGREVIPTLPVGSEETQEQSYATQDVAAADVHVIKTPASAMPYDV